MHPQTLRKYERLGLVRPSRTVGMLRLYSEEDIVRLELIKHLVGELGLNLAGVRMAIGLFNKLILLKKEMEPAGNVELRKLLSEGIVQRHRFCLFRKILTGFWLIIEYKIFL